MQNTIRTKIVGVSYRNEDGTKRQEIISDLHTGESLHLVDMSTEEHPEAIGVFDVADQQCGFLNKALAKDIRSSGKDFEKFDVEVLEITGGDDQHYGCNIEITVDSFMSCLVSVGDFGVLTITTPLVDSSSEAGNLSIGQQLYLKCIPQQGKPPIMHVCDAQGHFCGEMPPFACEQIANRNLTPDDFMVSVVELRPNAHNGFACRIRCTNEGSSDVAANKAKADQEALAHRAYGASANSHFPSAATPPTSVNSNPAPKRTEARPNDAFKCPDSIGEKKKSPLGAILGIIVLLFVLYYFFK